ncbi:MAG TPA: hypothetical protein VNS09_27015 [Solirubrobacter sp.]|nr:hypothetical protein [Solirubrobacter sp.]
MAPAPLQIMIVNFEHTNFTGEIEAELERLENAGILRVHDVLYVGKSQDGDIEVLRAGDAYAGTLASTLLGIDGDEAVVEEVESDEDVWYVADAIAPGGGAGIAVLEYVWAGPLRDAIVGAGGTGVVTEWVHPDQLADLGVTLAD